MTAVAKFVTGLVFLSLLALALLGAYTAIMVVIWESQCGSGQAC